MRRRAKTLKAIDFFCGAGGLTRGLLDAGIDVLLGIDANPSCEKTYVRNNRPAQFLCADLTKMEIKALKSHIRGIPRSQLIFAACAPCQPFAVLNKSQTRGGDRFLLRHFSRFVRHYKPKYVFLENVPGIARIRTASTLARFRKMLARVGYKIAEGAVDAKHYGVPQTRRRYILLAAHKSPIALPGPTHGTERRPFRTVRSAIARFPRLKAGRTHSKVKNHVAASVSDINLQRLKATPKNGGDRRAWPKPLILACHAAKHDGHSDVYGRMAWDKPAPTLTCKCNSISNGRYGHPTQARAISLREAAALQSFRDSYVFYGEHRSLIAEKIGNAVPVRLAKRVGKVFTSIASIAQPKKRKSRSGRIVPP